MSPIFLFQIMNGASLPLIPFQDKCIQLSTRNKISLCNTTKLIAPSREIITQETIRQSEKHLKNRKPHKKSTRQTTYVHNRGIKAAKHIGILFCLIFVILPDQTCARINCRYCDIKYEIYFWASKVYQIIFILN